MPTALITGITGQDGSYLAEFLLAKGYRVVGIVRRSSTTPYERIGHLVDQIELVSADLLDQTSLTDAVGTAVPDEIYNLAAQSFVQTSWTQPVLTGEFTALGVTRMLEAMRKAAPTARFYQASSSEMFGKVIETPQNEHTPFYPRSPYGVAKVYGHWITVNYRESFGLYAVSGILFNHECVSGTTPLLVRETATGGVDVVTPDELMPLLREGPSTQTYGLPGLEVWDGSAWTPASCVTATRRRPRDADHAMRSIEAPGGVVRVTTHHTMLTAALDPRRAGDVGAGDPLALADTFPAPPGWTSVNRDLAEFLGLCAAHAHVAPESGRPLQFTSDDDEPRDRVATLWSKLFLGTATGSSASGADPSRTAGPLELGGRDELTSWLRSQLYHRGGHKRVPKLILNAPAEVQCAFLTGYRAADGLHAAGRDVATDSALVAQGLCWLYANQGRATRVCVEHGGGQTQYRVTVGARSPLGQRADAFCAAAGHVSQVVDADADAEDEDEDAWVFDLETASGRFCAGVGRLVVHNSPRRGLEFVTRKVTDGAARIKLGLSTELRLGTLDARRDWGYAGDYVDAMWRMLQQPTPGDYVIGTGQTWSVRELCEAAFGAVGLDYRQYVVQDPRFIRPAEVDVLVADPTRARTQLGWTPTVGFRELVAMMVDADLARHRRAAH